MLGVIGCLGFQQMRAANEIAPVRVWGDGKPAQIDREAAARDRGGLMQQREGLAISIQVIFDATGLRIGRRGNRGFIARWAGRAGLVGQTREGFAEQNSTILGRRNPWIPSIQLRKRGGITSIVDGRDLSDNQSIEGESPGDKENHEACQGKTAQPNQAFPPPNRLPNANAHSWILALFRAKQKRHHSGQVRRHRDLGPRSRRLVLLPSNPDRRRFPWSTQS